MERAVINKRINRITSEIDRLKSALVALESTDISKCPENYNMLIYDAALRSELIACRMRHLIYQSTDIKKQEYLLSAGVVQGIEIEEKDGVFEINLPCLLPKRKIRQSTEFLIDDLLYRFLQFTICLSE